METLKKITPSFESCVELKKAGFEQDTFCFYRKTPIGNYVLTTLTSYPFIEDKCIAAPTLAEISIPPGWFIFKEILNIHVYQFRPVKWYSSAEHDRFSEKEVHDTEIEAKVSLWLYLNKKID